MPRRIVPQLQQTFTSQPSAEPVSLPTPTIDTRADLSRFRSFSALSPSVAEFLRGLVLRQRESQEKDATAILAAEGGAIAKVVQDSNQAATPAEREKIFQKGYADLVRKGVLPEGGNPALLRRVKREAGRAELAQLQADALTEAAKGENVLDENGRLQPVDDFGSAFDALVNERLSPTLFGDEFVREELGTELQNIRLQALMAHGEARAKGMAALGREQVKGQVLSTARQMLAQVEGDPEGNRDAPAEFKLLLGVIDSQARLEGGLTDSRQLVVEGIRVAAKEVALEDPEQALMLLRWSKDTKIGQTKLGDDPDSLETLNSLEAHFLQLAEEKELADAENTAALTRIRKQQAFDLALGRIQQLQDEGKDPSDYKLELFEIAQQTALEGAPEVRNKIEAHLREVVQLDSVSDPKVVSDLQELLESGSIPEDEMREMIETAREAGEVRGSEYASLLRQQSTRTRFPPEVGQMREEIQVALRFGDPQIDLQFAAEADGILQMFDARMEAVMSDPTLTAPGAREAKVKQLSKEARAVAFQAATKVKQTRAELVRTETAKLEAASNNFTLTNQMVEQAASAGKFTMEERMKWTEQASSVSYQKENLIQQALAPYNRHIAELLEASEDPEISQLSDEARLRKSNELGAQLRSIADDFTRTGLNGTDPAKMHAALQATLQEAYKKIELENTFLGQVQRAERGEALRETPSIDGPAVANAAVFDLYKAARKNGRTLSDVKDRTQINLLREAWDGTPSKPERAALMTSLFRESGISLDEALDGLVVVQSNGAEKPLQLRFKTKSIDVLNTPLFKTEADLRDALRNRQEDIERLFAKLDLDDSDLEEWTASQLRAIARVSQ